MVSTAPLWYLEEEYRRPRVKYGHAEADVLLETDLNHVPQCQKFSGEAEAGCGGAGHQPGSTDTGVPRAAHRRRPIPRFREHAQSCVQGTATAAIEEGSD